jgi:hypothetical protein
VSEQDPLGHPGTKRPPHSCPFPDVHARLDDAHYLWHEAQINYFSPPRFRTNLNALIQTLRTITWLIQKNKGRIRDFNDWYSLWQKRMKDDDVLRWLVHARNKIEKQGDLEKHSILRISLVASHTNELFYDMIDTPSLKTTDILRQIDVEAIPEELIEHALLRLERRWVAADLPAHELLNALAHVYGFLSDLVDDAHSQAGLPVPLLITPQENGSFRPFSGSTAYFQGRLPCMMAADDYRQQWIDLKSGAYLQLRSKSYKFNPRKIRKIKRRYDMSLIDGKSPTSLEEWVWHLWRMARHMFERDGHHIQISFMLHRNDLLDLRQMEAASHRELYPFFRSLANEVARRGATEVIVISEIWIAPFDPAQPYRRAELSPERGEGLQLSAVSANGEQINLFAPITRNSKKAKLGETEVDRTRVARFLAPITAVWRHP